MVPYRLVQTAVSRVESWQAFGDGVNARSFAWHKNRHPRLQDDGLNQWLSFDATF
jgi:hypothetical protein